VSSANRLIPGRVNTFARVPQPLPDQRLRAAFRTRSLDTAIRTRQIGHKS